MSNAPYACAGGVMMNKPSYYMVFDVETNTKNKGDNAIGKMAANPFHPKNRIVLFGCTSVNALRTTTYYKRSPLILPPRGTLLVGHNIKFDLLYWMKEDNEFRDSMHIYSIWDTALCEYILSGQTHKYPKLQDLSLKYGGSGKDDEVSEMIKAGVDPEDIPEDLLAKYLYRDVKETERVFLAQHEQVLERGIEGLVASQMRAVQATTEMEWNGMAFDSNLAENELKIVGEKIKELEESLSKELKKRITRLTSPNPLSNKQLSLYLFGGEYKYKAPKILMDEFSFPQRYKSGAKKGKIKTKIVEWVETIHKKTYGDYDPTPTKQPNTFVVDDAELKKLMVCPGVNKHVVQQVLDLRALKKQGGTYYEGCLGLVWPDGIIHHNLNHTATATGRLSSSNPNAQNMSKKDV